MSEILGQKVKKILTAFLICGSFLFIFFSNSVLAFNTLETYQKAVNGTLTSAEWNGLLYDSNGVAGNGDFVNTWLPAKMNGPLGIATSPTAGISLDVNGIIRASSKVLVIGSNPVIGIGDANPANTLSVVGNISGSESLKISSSTAANWISGNFGVGNASAGSSKLSVFGNAAIGTGYLNYSAPANGLIVQGNVGIGTTNPTAKLDVYSDADALVNLTSAINQNSGFGMYEGSSSSGYGFKLFYDGLSTNNFLIQSIPYGTTTPVTRLTIIRDNGNVGIGTTAPKGLLHVYSAASSTNALVVANNGYIGIGTTNPGATLHINGNTVTTGLAFSSDPTDVKVSWSQIVSAGGGNQWTTSEANENNIYNSSYETGNVGIGITAPIGRLNVVSSDYNTLNLSTSGVDSNMRLFGNASGSGGFIIAGGGGADFIAFRTGATSGAFNGTERVRITSGGNVGIGTTTPNAKLQVMGSVNATGLCLSGDCKSAWSDIVSAGGGLNFTGTNGQTIRNNNGTWAADSNIYNNGTYVGIGDTAPSDKLTIVGGLYATNGLKIGSSTAANWIYGRLGVGHGTAGASKFAVNGNASIGDAYFSSAAPADGLIVEGNVGIGTTNPAYSKLDVGGTSQINAAVYPFVGITNTADNIQALQLQNKSTGVSAEMRFITSANDNSYLAFTQPGTGNTSTSFFGVAKSSGSFIFNSANGGTDRNMYIGTLGASNSVNFGTNNLIRATILASGYVGIGTTAPNAKLQVMGSVNATGLCLSGDCKVSWDDIVSAGGVGAGTNGQTLRNDSGNGWIANSNIYNNGTYVGIGTTVPGTNKLSVIGNIAGVGDLKISSSTNSFVSSKLGVGHLTSGTSILAVNGNASIGDAYFSSAAPADGLIVEGNVGIGTTAPLGKLDIATGNGLALVFGSDVNATTRTTLVQKFGRIGMPHYNLAEEPIILFTADSQASLTRLNFGGGTSAGNAATELNFYTAANNTTAVGTNRMIINSSGNVGIGTTTPTEKLEVNGKVKIGDNTISGENFTFVDTAPGMKVQNQYGNLNITPLNGGWLHFYTDRSNFIFNKPIYIIGGRLASYDTSNLTLSAGGTDNDLTITNTSGNVGIGTSTPNTKLQVMGSVNATGLCLSGDCKVSWADIVSAGGVGTGTNGQTLRNNGTTWIADSNIYNNGSYVGIGTTVPGTNKLSVIGNIAGVGDLKISSSTNSFVSSKLGVGHLTSGTSMLAINGNASIGDAYFSSAAPADGLIVEGNVGIGTTGPGYKLDVNGTFKATASSSSIILNSSGDIMIGI